MISTAQIILIVIASCLIGIGSVLEEFQTHRPLFACTLIGIILGDVKTGIIIGGNLEMLALGWMTIGAAQAPDPGIASVISTVLVIAGHQKLGTGIALAIPLASAGQVLLILTKTVTVAMQHLADKYAEKGDLKGIDLCHIGCLAIHALRVAIPALIVSLFITSSAVQSALNAIPKVVTGGLGVAGGFIVVVGYAMVINMMEARYLMPFFFLGFVIAAFTNFNLVAFGVVGTVFAIVYIQLNPKYSKPVVVSSGNSGTNDNLDDELD